MRKKDLILLICGFFCFTKNTFAATNPYVPTTEWGINCTWNTWQQVYDRLGIALPGWGNANTWLNFAKKAGFEVGSTPRANSIVVWQWSDYGHVAFVEEVKDDKIYVWENKIGCKDETPEYYACLDTIDSPAPYRDCEKYLGPAHGCEKNALYWHTPGDLIGYIYLDKIPTKKPTSSTTTTPVTKKSNNAFLKSLTISDIEFAFDKNVFEYNLEVENDTIKVKVEGIKEQQAAKVDGNKEYQLEIGANLIQVIVTAEDGTRKTYSLHIKRKDNNANISSLSISNLDFLFQPDNFEYNLEVENSINNITIDATLESTLAKIEGIGEHQLEEGENIIVLTVTAEDNTTKAYTFKINREISKLEMPKKESNNIGIILGIAGALLAIIGGVILIIIKRRKQK